MLRAEGKATLPMDAARLQVVIVGSGPSGFYAAEALLGGRSDVSVDMIERLPVPYGLVRHGVAPDHQKLKQVTKVYQRIAADSRFSFFGNVELGRDLSVEQLGALYHAIVVATGAGEGARLHIPGERLPGVHDATSFVGWYNGHPDFRDCRFDLSVDRAVIVGHGNVALDICRMLAKPAEALQRTDIAAHAADALVRNNIRRIDLIGRRGPAQAKFTPRELQELDNLPGWAVHVDPTALERDESSQAGLDQHSNTERARNVEILRRWTGPLPAADKVCHIRFLLAPHSIQQDGKAIVLTCARTQLRSGPFNVEAVPTGEFITMRVGLVIRSIGYRGRPLPGLPFDRDRGTIRHDRGRVGTTTTGARIYATGWIKRGPQGIIGTNRADSIETIDSLIADLGGLSTLPKPGSFGLGRILEAGSVQIVGDADWQRIDRREIERGTAIGKPREKYTRIHEMLAACLP